MQVGTFISACATVLCPPIRISAIVRPDMINSQVVFSLISEDLSCLANALLLPGWYAFDSSFGKHCVFRSNVNEAFHDIEYPRGILHKINRVLVTAGLWCPVW